MIKQIIPILLDHSFAHRYQIVSVPNAPFQAIQLACNIDIKQAKVLLQLFWRITLRVDRDEYDLQRLCIHTRRIQISRAAASVVKVVGQTSGQ